MSIISLCFLSPRSHVYSHPLTFLFSLLLSSSLTHLNYCLNEFYFCWWGDSSRHYVMITCVAFACGSDVRLSFALYCQHTEGVDAENGVVACIPVCTCVGSEDAEGRQDERDREKKKKKQRGSMIGTAIKARRREEGRREEGRGEEERREERKRGEERTYQLYSPLPPVALSVYWCLI